VFLFGIAPFLHFTIRQRFALIPRSWKKERASVHATNVVVFGAIAGMSAIVGLKPFLLVHLPVTLMASSLGVILFQVQHQFEGTYWRSHDHWDYHEAIMHGSSCLHLPRWLHWFTVNIGFRHIHHLDSRVPNYRLKDCYRKHRVLREVKHLGVSDILKCINFHLWDDQQMRMLSFSELRSARRPACDAPHGNLCRGVAGRGSAAAPRAAE
jgi:omega-6 fatty acid desaturase (delta-12 desaturase)